MKTLFKKAFDFVMFNADILGRLIFVEPGSFTDKRPVRPVPRRAAPRATPTPGPAPAPGSVRAMRRTPRSNADA